MREEVIVAVNDGKIRGISQHSCFSNTEYYSFYGVPYAEPPIGSLRFRDPVRVSPWKGIRNGTTEKGGCSQFAIMRLSFMGSEDCLYVNIHTPGLASSKEPLKAVVAHIHPGGLLWGSPDPTQHGSPDFIMNRDIVYVNIGYRINIFGFFNLKEENCSGNQGVKDIIMALKWIKNNIGHFNGDAENVTLMGSSSGAMLVHVIMLLPAARGLFHKAIVMGHHAFNALIVHQDEQVQMAFDLGKQLGFRGKNTKQLLTFFKKLSPLEIVEGMRVFQNKMLPNIVRAAFGSVFNLTIDYGEHAIIPESPRKFIKSIERVPLIFGICDREAVTAFIKSALETTERNFRKGYQQNCWGWMRSLTDQELDEMHQEIVSFYSKNVPDAKTPLAITQAILSDAAFSEVYDTLINPISAVLPSSTYVYKFQYEGELNLSRVNFHPFMAEKFTGAYHFDDFCYWAPIVPLMSNNLSTNMMIDLITKLFTNFAKTGNPNFENLPIKWKPSIITKPCYLSINQTLTMIEGKLNRERFEFWDTLKKRYYKEKD